MSREVIKSTTIHGVMLNIAQQTSLLTIQTNDGDSLHLTPAMWRWLLANVYTPVNDDIAVMHTLIRKLASQVEISAPRDDEPSSVAGIDTHDQVELTADEYTLLMEVTN